MLTIEIPSSVFYGGTPKKTNYKPNLKLKLLASPITEIKGNLPYIKAILG